MVRIVLIECKDLILRIDGGWLLVGSVATVHGDLCTSRKLGVAWAMPSMPGAGSRESSNGPACDGLLFGTLERIVPKGEPTQTGGDLSPMCGLWLVM